MRGRIVLIEWKEFYNLRHNPAAFTIIAFCESVEIIRRRLILPIADNTQYQNLTSQSFKRNH